MGLLYAYTQRSVASWIGSNDNSYLSGEMELAEIYRFRAVFPPPSLVSSYYHKSIGETAGILGKFKNKCSIRNGYGDDTFKTICNCLPNNLSMAEHCTCKLNYVQITRAGVVT